MPDSNKTSYVFKQTCSQKLYVFLNTHWPFITTGLKGLIHLSADYNRMFLLVHKKWSFPLRISPVNSMKKSLIENLIFCTVCYIEAEPSVILQSHGRNILTKTFSWYFGWKWMGLIYRLKKIGKFSAIFCSLNFTETAWFHKDYGS